jgi:hypothetical protein
MPRPTPFELVFHEIAPAAFPGIRSALEREGQDAANRDAFLMVPEVVTLVRDLRPEEGVGEAIDQLVALAHHAYLAWDAGTLTLPVSPAETERLLRPGYASPRDPGEPPRAFYAQLPVRRIWASVVQDLPAEPMDGCFVHSTGAGELRVLGVFGMRPERSGFSVVESSGPRAGGLERADGSPLFGPVLRGGAAAGLYSLTGGEELLELGWRARALASQQSAEAAPWKA